MNNTIRNTLLITLIATMLIAPSMALTQAHARTLAPYEPGDAQQAVQPFVDLTGSWALNYYMGGTFTHTMVISYFNPGTGAFLGTGYSNTDNSIIWTVTGTETLSEAGTPLISFHLIYTGFGAGYYVDATGQINSNTAMAGVGNSYFSATWYQGLGTWDATEIPTYLITATAGNNGAIEPPGNVAVNSGSDQTYTITPNSGYHIADVQVDGISIGPANSYTFTNVQADHTISARFALDAFQLNFPEGSTATTAILVSETPPETLPDLPNATGPYYDVFIVSGSFSGSVQVALHYDPGTMTLEEQQNLRLCVGDPVDFNHDGTVNWIDIVLIERTIASGKYYPTYDVNHDGVVDNADLNIVQQFASQGLIVHIFPGDQGVTLPWMDITTSVDTVNHIIYGVTDHFSGFGVH